MKLVMDLCAHKNICESSPVDAEEFITEPEEVEINGVKRLIRRGHGGCGNRQPKITRSGLSMTYEVKRSKAEEVSWHLPLLPSFP
jgi:hypothetical protein